MTHESHNKIIELPDRKEITLSEAVTAFVYGSAWDAAQRLGLHSVRMGIGPVLTIEQRAVLNNLLEQLNSAAYSRQIKFRGLRVGESAGHGHKDIDPLYFAHQRGFEWYSDRIWDRDPAESADAIENWYDVHLDRQAFVSWLRDMSISVRQNSDADVPGQRTTYRTAAAGRPSSMDFILEIAQRRLSAGDYPESQTQFSEELAAQLKTAEPRAVSTRPKTIRNSAAFKELWRHRPPKKIDVS